MWSNCNPNFPVTIFISDPNFNSKHTICNINSQFNHDFCIKTLKWQCSKTFVTLKQEQKKKKQPWQICAWVILSTRCSDFRLSVLIFQLSLSLLWNKKPFYYKYEDPAKGGVWGLVLENQLSQGCCNCCWLPTEVDKGCRLLNTNSYTDKQNLIIHVNWTNICFPPNDPENRGTSNFKEPQSWGTANTECICVFFSPQLKN